MNCARCGREVVPAHAGLWAEVDGNVRTFTCDDEIRRYWHWSRWHPARGHRLVWARWHYVEGEQQQVWPEEDA